MRRKISDIANIYFGLQEKTNKLGKIKYLTSSHFDDSLQPTKFKDSFICECKDEERYVLQPNDIIVTGKGQRIFAWAYKQEFGKIVPSSIFYIIRIKSDSEVRSEYLANAINTDKIIFKLKSLGLGTSILSIQKNELAQIKINIPTLKEQDKVIDLARLLEKDVELHSLMLQKKRALKKELLNKIINN